jgi:hypothetical protein
MAKQAIDPAIGKPDTLSAAFSDYSYYFTVN